MAQLSNDCFAFGDAPLTIDEALAFVKNRIPMVAGIESLPLSQCDGRILADDLVANSALPAFFNAAVDGYAVQHTALDKAAPTRTVVRGRLQAGAVAIPELAKGTVMRIFTGAPMPTGADTVFMQEDVEVDGETVILPLGLKAGANCRARGEELHEGAIAIKAGTRLQPQHLALAAGTGHSTLPVRSRIRVALFSTGDELIEPGGGLGGGAVFDTNRIMLATLLTRAGCLVTDLGILRDEPENLRLALRSAAATHDLILTSGGVSTGEADYVKSAVEAEGRLDYWRFAIKPGRPLAMGIVGGTAFAGLPGNPVAVFITFTQIVRHIIAALGGETRPPPAYLPVKSGFSYRKKSGRIEFLRVSLRRADGIISAIRFPIEGAGIISSLTASDGLVRLAMDTTDVSQGDSLDYLPFNAMLD